MNSVNLLGVRIDNVDATQTRALFAAWLGASNGQRTKTVCTPNPEFLLAAQQDAQFRKMLNDFDLNLPDGVGLRFASAALTEQSIRNRVPGVEALLMLAELCCREGERLHLLGEHDSCERAATNLRRMFWGLEVTTFDPGKVNMVGDLSKFTMEMIDEMKPAVMAIGLGQGKQEACIQQHIMRWPSVKIMIGVGGACAMIGNALPRAPRRWQQLGFEWLWRLWKEPRRYNRIWRAVVVFPITVIALTLKEQCFWRAVRQTIPEIFLQLIGR